MPRIYAHRTLFLPIIPHLRLCKLLTLHDARRRRGFADLSLGPLGHRAKPLSIAKILPRPGNWRHATRGLRAIFLRAPRAGRFWPRAGSGLILRAALV